MLKPTPPTGGFTSSTVRTAAIILISLFRTFEKWETDRFFTFLSLSFLSLGTIKNVQKRTEERREEKGREMRKEGRREKGREEKGKKKP